MKDPARSAKGPATDVRLAYASAAVLCLVGVFFLVRADAALQTVLGLALILSGVGVAVAIKTSMSPRRR